MNHRRFTPLVVSILSVLLLGAREIPSTDELRQMLADKQYKRVMREVARAMHLKGDDAIGYDKGQLLLIRGEAQLGLRVEPAAAKSFRDAADAATSDDDRATARAMSLLMSRCERLIYTPRTGDVAGREIDIIRDRKAALDALLADETAAIESKARAGREAKNIADVLDAARAVDAFAAVERAAGGSTARSEEFMRSLVARVETLLDDALIELDRKADTIEATARSPLPVPQQVQPGAAPPATFKMKKRGLSPGDEAALKGIMETCREIVSRNREVAAQLGAEPDRFRRATDFAIRLSSKAGAIMRADYSGITEQPVKPPAPAPAQPAAEEPSE